MKLPFDCMREVVSVNIEAPFDGNDCAVINVDDRYMFSWELMRNRNRGNRANINSRQRGPSRLRLCFLQPDLSLTA